MHVLINNETTSVSATATIEQMLEAIDLPAARGIAVAINQEVVPKPDWSSRRLQENDNITIIRATQGG